VSTNDETVILTDLYANRPVAVYGTLRSGQANHHHIARNNGIYMHKATIPGYALFDIGPFPFIAEHATERSVVVELWSFLDADWPNAIRSMDLLEGFIPGDTRNMYERTILKAEPWAMEDSRPVDVWAYVAIPGTTMHKHYYANEARRARLIPTGDWNQR
jgi:gamma-glutamylcyclotransferase (GGCT)/AIG2-like uncharacterized protein YtfP